MSFVIANTIASDNGLVGVYYLPPRGSGALNANGVIDRVTATNNQFGVAINTYFVSGGTVHVTISNSTASNNSNDGAYIRSVNGSLTAIIDSSYMNNNVGNGIDGENNANIFLSRSVIASNAAGVNNVTSTFYTYGDNRINGNTTGVGGTALNTTDKPQ